MKKHMKKQKIKQKERGITLIALVVTIIVLLILAGVSIAMLTGQTGILKNAQQAREKTEIGQIKEDVQRDIMEKMIEKQGDITQGELYEILNNYFKDVPAPGEGEANPWNAKDFPKDFPELKSREGNYSFKLGDIYSGNLSGTEPTTPPTPTTWVTVAPENLKEYQGSYVDIGLNIVGDSKTTDDWKIFYVGGADKDNSEGEEEGRIFLIAADYVESDSETLSGILSDTGLSTDGSYNVYWSSPTWKNLPTIEGINFSKFIKHNQFTLKNGNPNAAAVSQLLNTTKWNEIVANAGGKDKIEFCIGGPTLEMWCAAWNVNMPESGEADTDKFMKITVGGTNETGYYVSSKSMKEKTFLYMDGKQSGVSNSETLGKKYPTFFPQTGVVSSNCYGYWLASPSASSSSDLMMVGYDGSLFYNGYNYNFCCVRPVICLQSGVKLQKIEEESNDKPAVYNLIKSN